MSTWVACCHYPILDVPGHASGLRLESGESISLHSHAFYMHVHLYLLCCISSFHLCISNSLHIKRCSQGFALLHAKSREHTLNVALLEHGEGAGNPIPINLHPQEEVQLPKITHVKLLFQFRLKLHQLSHVAYQDVEVVHIDVLEMKEGDTHIQAQAQEMKRENIEITKV